MGKVISLSMIDLKPGVTEAEFIDALRSAHYAVPGQTIYLAKADRGPHRGQYAVMVEFESVELRDRYFPTEGKASDEYTQLVAPFLSEMERFGSLTTWGDHRFSDYHVLAQNV